MSQQNIMLQIQALEQLKIELENLVKDVEVRTNSYFQHVSALAQTGLDSSMVSNFKDKYWRQDYAMLSQLKQHVSSVDIKYIESCIVSAKKALSSYKQ